MDRRGLLGLWGIGRSGNSVPDIQSDGFEVRNLEGRRSLRGIENQRGLMLVIYPGHLVYLNLDELVQTRKQIACPMPHLHSRSGKESQHGL